MPSWPASTSPLASAPQGTASVHGLIKTLFPVADANPGVLVPLTPESSVLLSLPVPPDAASSARRGRRGELMKACSLSGRRPIGSV